MFDGLTELECVIEKVAAEVADLDVERMCRDRGATRVQERCFVYGRSERGLLWRASSICTRHP